MHSINYSWGDSVKDHRKKQSLRGPVGQNFLVTSSEQKWTGQCSCHTEMATVVRCWVIFHMQFSDPLVMWMQNPLMHSKSHPKLLLLTPQSLSNFGYSQSHLEGAWTGDSRLALRIISLSVLRCRRKQSSCNKAISFYFIYLPMCLHFYTVFITIVF